MKYLIVSIFLLTLKFSFAQPNPQERYPERIKAITEQLKTDSLNYELIWERLHMRVNLLGGFGLMEEIFLTNVDSNKKAQIRAYHFDELNTDFNKIYERIIKVKKYDIVEEGDFYLNRIWFYFNVNEIDRAIIDARYLRDSASYSRYWQKGDYYNNWALYSLFTLSITDNNFEDALEAIDTMLKKKKLKDPKVYFTGHGSFLSYREKIKLFEHFNKLDKIIPYLKENCKEHFDWYFENAPLNDYSSYSAKHQSFEVLKLLVHYMKKYGDKAPDKYEKIYGQLRYRVNENFETINPNLSDEQLKTIVSEIK